MQLWGYAFPWSCIPLSTVPILTTSNPQRYLPAVTNLDLSFTVVNLFGFLGRLHTLPNVYL